METRSKVIILSVLSIFKNGVCTEVLSNLTTSFDNNFIIILIQKRFKNSQKNNYVTSISNAPRLQNHKSLILRDKISNP